MEVKGTNKVTLLQMGMWYSASHVEALSWRDLPWAVGSLNAVLGGALPFRPEEMASSPLSLLSQSLCWVLDVLCTNSMPSLVSLSEMHPRLQNGLKGSLQFCSSNSQPQLKISCLWKGQNIVPSVAFSLG